MAACKEARQGCSFQVGDVIEHRCFTSGYRGSWFRAKVVDVSRGEAADTKYLHVLYVDSNKEPHTFRLYDALPSKYSKESAQELMARPDPPHHYFSRKPFSTPALEHGYRPMLFFHRTEKYAVGDAVDALFTDCWWEGHVKGIYDDHVEVAITNPPKDIQIIKTRYLRPTLLWKDEKWTIPPRKNGLPPLGVFEDENVQSSTDEDVSNPAPPNKRVRPEESGDLGDQFWLSHVIPASLASSEAVTTESDVSNARVRAHPQTGLGGAGGKEGKEKGSDSLENPGLGVQLDRGENMEPFPELTDDNVRQGFETLLEYVPRAKQPGMQQLGLRGYFREKVEEMNVQELFPSVGANNLRERAPDISPAQGVRECALSGPAGAYDEEAESGEDEVTVSGVKRKRVDSSNENRYVRSRKEEAGLRIGPWGKGFTEECHLAAGVTNEGHVADADVGEDHVGSFGEAVVALGAKNGRPGDNESSLREKKVAGFVLEDGTREEGKRFLENNLLGGSFLDGTEGRPGGNDEAKDLNEDDFLQFCTDVGGGHEGEFFDGGLEECPLASSISLEASQKGDGLGGREEHLPGRGRSGGIAGSVGGKVVPAAKQTEGTAGDCKAELPGPAWGFSNPVDLPECSSSEESPLGIVPAESIHTALYSGETNRGPWKSGLSWKVEGRENLPCREEFHSTVAQDGTLKSGSSSGEGTFVATPRPEAVSSVEREEEDEGITEVQVQQEWEGKNAGRQKPIEEKEKKRKGKEGSPTGELSYRKTCGSRTELGQAEIAPAMGKEQDGGGRGAHVERRFDQEENGGRVPAAPEPPKMQLFRGVPIPAGRSVSPPRTPGETPVRRAGPQRMGRNCAECSERSGQNVPMRNHVCPFRRRKSAQPRGPPPILPRPQFWGSTTVVTHTWPVFSPYQMPYGHPNSPSDSQSDRQASGR